MFGFRAPVITISVVFDIVIVEVTIIIRIMRDITRDDLVEVSGVVTRMGRGRSWSGQLSGGQGDGNNRSS